MQYAHFAEICEKCSSMLNMRQSHIHVKLTCLYTSALTYLLPQANSASQPQQDGKQVTAKGQWQSSAIC